MCLDFIPTTGLSSQISSFHIYIQQPDSFSSFFLIYRDGIGEGVIPGSTTESHQQQKYKLIKIIFLVQNAYLADNITMLAVMEKYIDSIIHAFNSN